MSANSPLDLSLANAFFEQHPDAALIVDARGDVVHANPAAAWLGVDGAYPGFERLTGLPWPGDTPGQGGIAPGGSRRSTATGSHFSTLPDALGTRLPLP